MKLEYKVEKEYDNINQILKTKLKISSRLISKLITNRKILLNNQICDTRIKPRINDIIEVNLDIEEDNSNIVAKKMKIDIIYEDEGFLVVNKPSGIAVHPSLRHYSNSLSNGIKHYFDQIGLKKKIRPVNRLDLDTSGLIIFAKNDYIQECLIKQMVEKKFHKEYLCIVTGVLKEKEGKIDLPIARKKQSIIERCVREDGQQSITHYQVLKEKDDYSLVKCMLETGRTHQIRVHMAYIGHPLLGDTLYGKQSELINRQALHCYKLSLINPSTNKKINFINDLPMDMKSVIM